MNVIGSIVLLFAYFAHANAFKILCAYPTISRSHFIVVDALLRGLADKGHHVTAISGFPPDKPIKNYRHVLNEMSTSHANMMKLFTEQPGQEASIKMMAFLLEFMLHESETMLQNPEVKKLMDEESFDLLIIEFMGEPHIGLAAHFKCPVILFSSIKASFRHLSMIGNPLALSYVSHSMIRFTYPMNFRDRTLNMLFYLSEKTMGPIFISKYRELHNKHFPAPKYPTFDEIIKNVSAIFTSQHFSEGGVRPNLPGVVEIAGIQITDTLNPLPDGLQQWMDGSTNGVIYFSLGSNLKTSNLPPEKLGAIVKVFSRLQQNILWKSEKIIIPDLPSNVRMENWLPQLDVLQHSNLQLFITHGGFGSITEAKYYGIPLIVIPIFADQISNSDIVASDGWGMKLTYDDLNEQTLDDAIAEMLTNSKYVSQAKYLSLLFRDRPLTPLQNGIYWVEYICRHKGAQHMRSKAIELNFVQLHSIDVIVFLLTVLLIVNLLIFKCFVYLFKKLFGRRRPKVKTI